MKKPDREFAAAILCKVSGESKADSILRPSDLTEYRLVLWRHYLGVKERLSTRQSMGYVLQKELVGIGRALTAGEFLQMCACQKFCF